MCKIFSLFWGSFQQYCSNLSTKDFLCPYVSYMIGKLLTWVLIICGVKDFLGISKRFRILMTARDSNEGYISKCVLKALTNQWPQTDTDVVTNLFPLCISSVGRATTPNCSRAIGTTSTSTPTNCTCEYFLNKFKSYSKISGVFNKT